MRQSSAFVGGGHLTGVNEKVWGALHRAAGCGTPTIAVICSAADGKTQARQAFYEDDGEYLGYQKLFRNYGFDPVWIPAAIDNYREVAYDAEIAERVSEASAIWFNGGDQAKHARCLLRDDGTDTPLLAAARAVFKRGGVIAGSSAGAAIQGRYTFGEGTAAGYLAKRELVAKAISDVSLRDPDDENNGGYTRGFGFLSDIDACVDTHFSQRGREGRLPIAVSCLGSRYGIGIDEGTAMHIQDGTGIVHGEDKVVVVERSLMDENSLRHGEIPAFVLHHGSRFDFAACRAWTQEGTAIPLTRI